MALQKAFVIDGDKSRYAQISTVLSFLSYKVKSLSIAKAAGGVAKPIAVKRWLKNSSKNQNNKKFLLKAVKSKTKRMSEFLRVRLSVNKDTLSCLDKHHRYFYFFLAAPDL
ncbi:MAG: hypothetical protein ABGX28_00545 [Methylococcales bacterium]